MIEVPSLVGADFYNFARKPIQSAFEEPIDTIYKPIASVGKSDLEFLIPANSDAYLDLDIKLYEKSQLIKPDVTALDEKDFTPGMNNFVHSLFIQCSISLNGMQITQATELYNYRAYLETLLTYGTDADFSHLTNAYWYLDSGDLLPCDT